MAQVQMAGIRAAYGETSDGAWEFDRGNLLDERIVVRVLPSRVEVARFQWGSGGAFAGYGHGLLAFPDGRTFRLGKTAGGGGGGFLAGLTATISTDWTLFNSAQMPLLRMWADGAMWGGAPIQAQLYPACSQAIELPLLVVLTAFVSWEAVQASRSNAGGGI